MYDKFTEIWEGKEMYGSFVDDWKTPDEYISKEAAVKAIASVMPSMSTPDGSGENDHLVLAAQEMCIDAIQAVRDVPAVDVEPVVHAKWKSVYGTHRPRVACTNCKYDVKSQLKYYKHCPNCGAKIDRGTPWNQKFL